MEASGDPKGSNQASIQGKEGDVAGTATRRRAAQQGFRVLRAVQILEAKDNKGKGVRGSNRHPAT